MRMKFLDGVYDAIFNLKDDIVKYSPEVLAGCGIAGFIASIVLTAKAAPKACKKIEQAPKNIVVVYDDDGYGHEEWRELSFMDKAKLVWKDYTPAMMLAVLSTSCVIASVTKSHRRLAGAMAMLAYEKDRYDNLQRSTEEVVGKKKAEAIEQKAAENEIDKASNSPIVINGISEKGVISKTIPGTTLFYEPYTNTFFYADFADFKTIAANFRDEFSNGPGDNIITFGSWLCDLGIDDYIPSDVLASWQASGWSTVSMYDVGTVPVKVTTRPIEAKRFGGMAVNKIEYSRDLEIDVMLRSDHIIGAY